MSQVFDIWDADSPGHRAEETGEHLGTATVPLWDCLPPIPRKQKLILQGEKLEAIGTWRVENFRELAKEEGFLGRLLFAFFVGFKLIVGKLYRST